MVAVAIRAGQTFAPMVGEPVDPPVGWLALDLRAHNTGPRTVRVLGLGGTDDRLALPAGDVVVPPGEMRLLLLRAQVSCTDERVPPPAPPVDFVVAAAAAPRCPPSVRARTGLHGHPRAGAARGRPLAAVVDVDRT